jgi:lantibiotic modifying enzyme
MVTMREYGHVYPAFVEDIINHLRDPQKIRTQGLFRLSGSASEIKAIAALYNSG